MSKWINPHWHNNIHCYDCSSCGKEAQHGEYRGVLENYKFCPSCGEKMENYRNENSSNDLELINQFERNPLTENEVYTFKIKLVDNQIDKDFECFSIQSLKKLKELFVGTKGVINHNWNTFNPPKIYKTSLEFDMNSQGETICNLIGHAYIARTPENKEIIEKISSHKAKEISIGCSVENYTCSICGKEQRYEKCEHKKGQYYNGKLCYFVLDGPTDVYDWAFVQEMDG